ncbi:hypothetical protein HELRODRAFT_171141 [Helobdella robusta]|uniref:Uncharacterized protein n=1 Tax=Helobdella robusta TaxID=6412 RepID=T1F3U6_HELRO|nr:hypothetical protein HELRODRAFT_171141 [Helobdella robusta]ESO05504.1 hypothetical protein HELRODRAFT_171141 [Helobdella robusta]
MADQLSELLTEANLINEKIAMVTKYQDDDEDDDGDDEIEEDDDYDVTGCYDDNDKEERKMCLTRNIHKLTDVVIGCQTHQKNVMKQLIAGLQKLQEMNETLSSSLSSSSSSSPSSLSSSSSSMLVTSKSFWDNGNHSRNDINNNNNSSNNNSNNSNNNYNSNNSNSNNKTYKFLNESTATFNSIKSFNISIDPYREELNLAKQLLLRVQVLKRNASNAKHPTNSTALQKLNKISLKLQHLSNLNDEIDEKLSATNEISSMLKKDFDELKVLEGTKKVNEGKMREVCEEWSSGMELMEVESLKIVGHSTIESASRLIEKVQSPNYFQSVDRLSVILEEILNISDGVERQSKDLLHQADVCEATAGNLQGRLEVSIKEYESLIRRRHHHHHGGGGGSGGGASAIDG